MDRESILKPCIPPKPMSPERVLKYKVQGDIHKRFGPTFGKSYVSVPTAAFVKVMEHADGYSKMKPSYDALVVDNEFLQKDVEDLQGKLHAEPLISDSREDEDVFGNQESNMEYNEEVGPNSVDGQREETRTERRSRIQRERRQMGKGKVKQKQFKAKQRSEHRPRKRDEKK